MHRRRSLFRRALSAGALLVAGAWLLCPKPELYGDFSFSTAVFDREGGLLRLSLARDDRYRLRTPLEKIAPSAVEAALLYEDAYFYYHPGINPISLLRAAWTTYVVRERTVGASTIAMQLARLRFDIDSRSLIGKLEQILRALQLERHYGKNEILEAYLNLAPFGGNVEGIGTASRVYFDKPAAALTTLEALTLAVIPQNPNVRSPGPEGEPAELIEARMRAFEAWREVHPEDADMASRAASALPARTIDDLPFRAPHFVDRILSRNPPPRRLRSTLSPGLQGAAEETVGGYLAERREMGLRNAAVMVVDTRDASVRALVGSADWFDDGIQGQVDGTGARRSPGSVLKPFIYALALDQGLIHPMTLLEDAPARYGAYTPENFDQGFVGPVVARDALIYSRNVPAVSLAARLRAPDFYEFLEGAGVEGMRPRGHYGLAIALGGIDVTMEEVVRLYAALANGGVARELAFLQEDMRARPGKRLLSGEASFITREMLARNPRPAHRDGTVEHADPYIPWKTGTSYAFRDAWSVGLVGPYVVAVWVGNFDGQGNPALIGGHAAAPLLFRLVDVLRARGVQPERSRSEPDGLNVRRVPVCAPTGDLPGRHCPRMAQAWFIPGVSPIKVSDVYRAVRIDPATEQRVCPDYGGPTRTRVYEFWPSDLLTLFRRAGLPRRTPPPFAQECSLTGTASTGERPRIVKPQPTLTYTLRPERLADERIPFHATADADARKLFWFLDGQFLGRSEPHEPFFWRPRPGRFEVRVVDDLGRADRTSLRVILLPATS
ncbi:MAG: penicillin-binding protein 1C [Gammaproteobacteria bacterium]|nr:penicillin-binding protein 1C [Gammaproteobacteria bacterium]